MRPNLSEVRDRARRLRREQTEAENKLWARLRARQLSGAKFRRQHPIGPFITDFCCVERGLVVELDGGQHADRIKADQLRSSFIENCGYRVLRFWDNELIENMGAVLEEIIRFLQDPHPCPLPKRARVKKKIL